MKISDIAKNYDGFILDLWGVIHDGQNLYPGVMETIQNLKNMGKEVVFLSNAPRRSHKVKQVLKNFGITEDYYIEAISSGEVTYQIIKKQKSNNYYYIGPKKDQDLLNGLDLTEVTDATKADFAVTTGFDYDDSTLEEKISQINECLKAGLKLYCANPDLIVVRQNGTKMLCAGVIGEYYEKAGGQVEYIGKPHIDVYDYALKYFKPKAKILAVGDGPETDIKGANNMNIDSVLVLGGILKAETRPLPDILQEKQAKPNYVIDNFSW